MRLLVTQSQLLGFGRNAIELATWISDQPCGGQLQSLSSRSGMIPTERQ